MRDYVVIVGLGVTGKSCLGYFLNQDISLVAIDTHKDPSELAMLSKQYPTVRFLTEYDSALMCSAKQVVVSPGVDLRAPLFQTIRQAGVEIVGDIELFVRQAQAPIIAVTGSNGKTTVATLCQQALTACGLQVLLAGNVGIAVLDLLQQAVPDYYVLELSSFQLETIESLQAKIAVVLNISPDHLDRYDSLSDYIAAKMRIYRHAECAFLNCDQNLQVKDSTQCLTYSVEGRDAQYGVCVEPGSVWLMKAGQRWCDLTTAKLQGQHHWQNALVVLMVVDAMKGAVAAALPTILSFTGIEHRCQWVANINGVAWYNDSKATNEGAAVAAITTLSQENKGKMVLIAGGDAKQSNLKSFSKTVSDYVSHVVALGQDQSLIANQLKSAVSVTCVDTMQAAVIKAYQVAEQGDIVLLSPACSSLDMFDNYAQRGAQFTQCVLGLSK